MHFLAEGRNDRIQRWIAEQVQPRTSEESTQVPDKSEPNIVSTVKGHSPEGKGEDGVFWQMEELEREMALTAYAFGRKHWPPSTNSIDTSILDFTDIQKLSQLAINELEQEIVSDLDADVCSSTPARRHDKRRDARIMSQPPVFPPTPQNFDLPLPIIQRSVPAPAPIETTPHTSENPPIAFVFQESASPVSSSIHFTPAALDNLEAFPSTPRSFTSFLKHLSDNGQNQNQDRFQELFLSPRLVTPKVTTNTLNIPLSGVVASPTTPYSMESDYSCKSTPSLSAFPPTPASTFPSKELRLPLSMKRETETIPEIPSGSPIITVVSPSTGTNKALPRSPFPSPELAEFPSSRVETDSVTKTCESPAQPEKRDGELLSDSASASDLLSAQLSSRFSAFSSKFSISSIEELEELPGNVHKCRWASTVGKRPNRSRSVSTNPTGRSKKHAPGSTSAPHSRTGSRNETGQFVNVRGHHPRAASKAGSRSGSLTMPDLSASISSLGASNSEELFPPSLSHNVVHSRTDSASSFIHHASQPPDNGSVSESPSQKMAKRRTFMSRISMGLRRSRSSGSNNSRPKRQRNKTHVATLSGPEHVYFSTSVSSPVVPTLATVQKSPLPIPDNFSAVTSPTLHSSSAVSYSNPSLPFKQPPRLTLSTQFGSTSTPTIRNPLTPKTPASSISASFFGSESTPAEPLPTIKWRECLILRGVCRDNKYDEPVIKWCEQFGEVDDILRVRGSGTIVVYFKEDDVMKKNCGAFDPREVNIAGVGIVTINWSRTVLPPDRKPSS